MQTSGQKDPESQRIMEFYVIYFSPINVRSYLQRVSPPWLPKYELARPIRHVKYIGESPWSISPKDVFVVPHVITWKRRRPIHYVMKPSSGWRHSSARSFQILYLQITCVVKRAQKWKRKLKFYDILNVIWQHDRLTEHSPRLFMFLLLVWFGYCLLVRFVVVIFLWNRIFMCSSGCLESNFVDCVSLKLKRSTYLDFPKHWD